jgi:hypothetical protein
MGARLSPWMNMYMMPKSVMPSPAPKHRLPAREGVMKP